MIAVLSLGAGVQSTTLALLAAHGEIPRPDYAVFADTGWEPRAVYDHLAWLTSPNVLPFPVHRVNGGDIREAIATRKTKRSGNFASVPWHIIKADGSTGIGRRECTAEFKLEPIVRQIRSLLGKPSPARIPSGAVTMLLGISRDEAHRMKPSRRQFIVNAYPLIDANMTRGDCYRWLERHGYPTPPKSSCIGCPYTSDRRWIDRRDNSPDEWQQAVEADRNLRRDGRSEFMHPSCVPLDEVDFSRLDPARQPDLFGNECEGMCGV